MNADYSSLERRALQSSLNHVVWEWKWSGSKQTSTTHLMATERVKRLQAIRAKDILDADDAHEVRMVAYGLGVLSDTYIESIDRSIEALVPKVIAERLLK